jgi:hypothetical protein
LHETRRGELSPLDEPMRRLLRMNAMRCSIYRNGATAEMLELFRAVDYMSAV